MEPHFLVIDVYKCQIERVTSKRHFSQHEKQLQQPRSFLSLRECRMTMHSVNFVIE